MGTDAITRIVLVLIFLKYSEGLNIKSINYEKNAEFCRSQSKSPYFDIDQVVGRTWRIYYSWNVPNSAICLDMTIKNTTSHITSRIWSDMHDYLETQPVWDAATLYVTLGESKHELLLFADQGAAGSFVGVPNIVKDGNMSPNRAAIPLVKFFLKVLNDGRYLLMLDCNMGISSLMSIERPPSREEVLKVARTLKLGEGSLSCYETKPSDPNSILKAEEAFQNWTTCAEFVNNTVFDLDKVVDIDWKIFYFWNPEIEETYNIKFRKPTKMLVDRYRVELEKDLKPAVSNWSNAVLFMETTIDFSALFIKTPTPGIFRVIPSTAFEYYEVPLLIFALKLVEPGYLGIENCKQRIGYALAPVDKMPYHYELEKAAKKLQLYNDFNRSHIAIPHRPLPTPYIARDDPDDDQDDNLDVEEDEGKVLFF